jgi:hypothetical protein
VYAASPLEAYEAGDFVSAAVVGAGSGGHIDLSLRASRGGAGHAVAADAAGAKAQAELASVADLSPGELVSGFVRNCSQKASDDACCEPKHPGLCSHGVVRSLLRAQGCFVALGRGVDARVLLSNLSDTFVPAPAAAFPAVRPCSHDCPCRARMRLC